MLAQPDSIPLPSTIGRYKISGVLGYGSMGVVYEAFDPVIERAVAVKTINFQLEVKEIRQFKERFRREAKAAGGLNHPNIVTIYDVSEDHDNAYIAMELLDGLTLRQILDVGQLSVERACGIIARTANALFYAHNRGVIHRDIKPANIVVTKNGLIKITDFGVAQFPASSSTLAGLLIGSPAYMSPEQIMGSPLDGRSDIFSLGVVLYELLNGREPFIGKNMHDLMYRILHENPPLLSRHSQISPELEKVVMRALAKNPDDRFQNAREFAYALRPLKIEKKSHTTKTFSGTTISDMLDNLPLDKLSKKLKNQAEKNLLSGTKTIKFKNRFLSIFLATVMGVLILILIDYFFPVLDEPPSSQITITQPKTIGQSELPIIVRPPPVATKPKIVHGQTPAIVTVIPGPHSGKDYGPKKPIIDIKKREQQQELNNQIKKLNEGLKDLKMQYTDVHPDVIIKKRRIETLEKQKKESAEE